MPFPESSLLLVALALPDPPPRPCTQVFEVWMTQQSDTVQHTAQAYAEREVRRLSLCAAVF